MIKKIHLLIAFLTVTGLPDAHAQLALAYRDTLLCPGESIKMCASIVSGKTDELNSDNNFSGVINIGFPFMFFGNNYTSCVVSGNGYLSFNTARASTPSEYTWPTIAGTTAVDNSILAALVDMNIAMGGKIRYQTTGTPGSRKFTLEWCNLPLYGCTTNKITTQIVLFEGSNNIEMHTSNIDPIVGNCPTASAGFYGKVLQGVRYFWSLSFFTPGRDPAGNWGTTGATNDARRYTPNSIATVYRIDTIPFNPTRILDSVDESSIKWYAAGNPQVPIATGACASVVTDMNIPYYVVKYSGPVGCLSDSVHYSDTVHIHLGASYDTTVASICEGESYRFYGQELTSSGRFDTLFYSSIGCDSVIALQLTVHPNPDVSIEGDVSREACEGSNAAFILTHPCADCRYQWTLNGDIIPGEEGDRIIVEASGVYRVTATSKYGCTAISERYRMNVHPRPIARILPFSDEVICAFDTLTLTAVAHTGYRYWWDPPKPFRDLTGNRGPEATGIFREPTNVVLTVFSEKGCSDSTHAFVRTYPCCEAFIPNAFSPNGDGVNDYFKPELQTGQVLIAMRIYDRYGAMVYDNSHPSKGWDGKYKNGMEAKMDNYMYLVQYECADKKIHIRKEFVFLMR